MATPQAAAGPAGDEAGVLTAEPASVLRRWEARSIPVALGVALVSILYSVGLFVLTRPHLSPALQRIQSVNPGTAAVTWSWTSVLVLLTVALSEEVFFRLGIQTYLEKRLHLTGSRYGITMVLTALLWALGHVGMLEPDWVKLVQIFPIGLLLGGLYRKYGVEASVLAHGVFNLVMMLLGSSLVN